ncbi:MAG: hypothetical protein U1E17_13360 [Geminicoccaceae bacterium]
MLKAHATMIVAALLAAAAPARAEVQILDLGDLSASLSAGLPGEPVLRRQVCVRATKGQDSYRVRVDSQDGRAFALTAADGRAQLPFVLVWDSQADATAERASPGEVGVFRISRRRCAADGWRAAFEVRLAHRRALAMPAGSYRGGLVIEIASP